MSLNQTEFIISTIGKEILRICFLNKKINQVEKKITFDFDYKLYSNGTMSFDWLKVIFMNIDSYFSPLISWTIIICLEKKKVLLEEIYKIKTLQKLIEGNIFCFCIKF